MQRKPKVRFGPTVKKLHVAEDSFRVVALFSRFLSADLKIGAIARIVVGCYRIRIIKELPGPALLPDGPGRAAGGFALFIGAGWDVFYPVLPRHKCD